LSFRTPGTSLEAKGAVNLQPEGFGEGQAHVALKSADLEPYLLALGIGLPQFGTGLPADAQGDLTLSPERFSLSGLNGTLEGNGIAGTLSLDRTAPGLPVTGSLQVDTLDLPWLAEAVYGPRSI
jgi:hypothetical protein